MPDALIIVDMQQGMLTGGAKHDLAAVVARINRLTESVRRSGGAILRIRHREETGSGFSPGTPGWQFLPELDQAPGDIEVEKRLNDAFAGTALEARLEALRPDRLLITGWATDYCVDTTVRSAVSRGYTVTVAKDAHTVSDRPHLPAHEVIRHHNWVWVGLIAPGTIEVTSTEDLLAEGRSGRA